MADIEDADYEEIGSTHRRALAKAGNNQNAVVRSGSGFGHREQRMIDRSPQGLMEQVFPSKVGDRIRKNLEALTDEARAKKSLVDADTDLREAIVKNRHIEEQAEERARRILIAEQAETEFVRQDVRLKQLQGDRLEAQLKREQRNDQQSEQRQLQALPEDEHTARLRRQVEQAELEVRLEELNAKKEDVRARAAGRNRSSDAARSEKATRRAVETPEFLAMVETAQTIDQIKSYHKTRRILVQQKLEMGSIAPEEAEEEYDEIDAQENDAIERFRERMDRQ